MSQELFCKTIAECVAMGIEQIALGGYGDAFMDRNIEEKILRIRKSLPNATLVSSSTLNPLHGRLHLLENLDVLRISWYGMSNETYDQIHGVKQGFDRVMRTMSELLKMPKRPYLSINFVVTPENAHEMEEWKAYFEPKVEEIQIWRPHNWAGAYPTAFNPSLLKAKSCFRVFSADDLVVRENGDVSLCCMDFNHNLVIGNIGKNTLAEILESSRLHEIREIFQKNRVDGSGLICERCDQRFDRSDALIYTSNKKVHVGESTKYKNLKES
jgi:radical SAM protein with 4Fe4S-binding SPASM domain